MPSNNNTKKANPVRTIVVDDSALFRRLITEMLEADGTIEVVDTAIDPLAARRKIKELNPDVLTLDVEMEGMDGITFLRNLMRLRPMPVVMVSSLTEHGADVTMRALSLGAVDFLCKPKIDIAESFKTQGAELREKVRAACRARVRALDSTASKPRKAPIMANNAVLARRAASQLIAVGASTGGTEAVMRMLTTMPGNGPGVVIVQHIPQAFSAAFARRLNDNTPLSVKEAADGDPILPGHAYVAPGGSHLFVEASGNGYRCGLSDGPAVNLHRPSVDVLFDSVKKHLGHNAVGVLLTGMGADGAKGLLGMRESGALTICQDETSSVVWGMPGAAVKLEAAQMVLPLDEISGAVVSHVSQPGVSAA